jgi:pimeloyl-ACP methyl ester carboxylesterase
MVVFIHGGATTARCWDWVRERVSPSLAVNVPGREDRPADLGTLTVDHAARSIAADIEASGAGDVVLVAHSSGGLFVPGVVELLGPARVSSILLNAASVPPEGGNGLDCMRTKHRDMTIQALEWAAKEGIKLDSPYPNRDTLRRSSGEELDEVQLDFMEQRSVAESLTVYESPIHWSVASAIPTTYVFNLVDRAVPLELQRTMAARLPVPPREIELPGGHLPMVTRPDDFAAVVEAVMPA